MPTLPESCVDLILTSPPYAEQRKKQYGGISEKNYPSWTICWMQVAKRLLKPHGSVAIVIRPHLHQGQIADYVLRTRLALRSVGWTECDELIWIKPNSPPLGSTLRPRRAWESILWFSQTNKPYCDPKANGTLSDRIGFKARKGVGDFKSGVKMVPEVGVARCKDYVEVGTASSNYDKDNTHPAQFPVELPMWLARLMCPEDGVILDPFLGSGTTAIACLRTKRHFVGIEMSEEYSAYATRRITKEREIIKHGKSPHGPDLAAAFSVLNDAACVSAENEDERNSLKRTAASADR